MSQIDKWEEKRKRKSRRKSGPPHQKPNVPLTPAPNLPDSITVGDLRVEGELDLSFFDSLEPDQDFMVNPSGATADDVYTVQIDSQTGKIGVQATDPTTITTAPPAYDEVVSDGGTPSTPTVTLVSGPGWIKVKWGASTGTSDPLHYKVFMRATSNPTTADDTYLVADTQTLESVVNKLTGGTQLDDTVTYKVIVKAYSRIAGGGTSADSAVASGSPAAIDASVTTINNLDAGNITTGTLSASFIATGNLTADYTLSGIIKTASSGARVEFDDDGVRLYDGGSTDYGAPSGAGVTIEFPVTGDGFFRGNLRALTLQLQQAPNSTPSSDASLEWWNGGNSSVGAYIFSYYFDSGDSSGSTFLTEAGATGGDAHNNIGAMNFDGDEAYLAVASRGDGTGDATAQVQGNVATLVNENYVSKFGRVDFDEVSGGFGSDNLPDVGTTRLVNIPGTLNADRGTIGTLMVQHDFQPTNDKDVGRNLAFAPSWYGDTLRQIAFVATDCTQIGTAPTTNTLVDDNYLGGYTGTGSTITDSAASAHWGVWTLRMGTTASTSFSNVTSVRDWPGTQAKRIYMGIIFRIPNASNATDRFDFAWGWMVGTDPRAVTEGIFLRYSDSKATPAGTASTFDLVHCSASNRSADALDDNGGAITLTTGQWYMAEMEIIPGTGTTVWITEPSGGSGPLTGTKTRKVNNYNSNFPAATLNMQQRTLIKRAAGSSNTRDIDVDALWTWIEYENDRVP
jgi:hypothetical protein